jgi:ribose 5-phosphate isomerase B
MIAIASDQAGYHLKEEIKKHILEKGYEVLDLGTDSTDSVDYPNFGLAAAEAVAGGKCSPGIIICGTGIGISMAASKVPGIRCALCCNGYMARMAREHNDANMLALGARVIGEGVAKDIVDIFLCTEFLGGRHARRVDLITDIDHKYRK